MHCTIVQGKKQTGQHPSGAGPFSFGSANFLTTSEGKRYGSFYGKLAHRHKLDREKRRRKAKLRACLTTKGVAQLPSLTNQRLARHVRQEINRAVNQFSTEHPDHQIADEDLDVRTMHWRARRMNAYLYAANLAHLLRQRAWGTRKRGQRARAAGAAGCSTTWADPAQFLPQANPDTLALEHGTPVPVVSGPGDPTLSEALVQLPPPGHPAATLLASADPDHPDGTWWSPGNDDRANAVPGALGGPAIRDWLAWLWCALFGWLPWAGCGG